MKRLLSSIDFNDVLILLGLGMLGWGLSGISLYMAAGVVGAVLMLIGLAGALIKVRRG